MGRKHNRQKYQQKHELAYVQETEARLQRLNQERQENIEAAKEFAKSHGIKKIGEGGYGCVYSPALNCKDYVHNGNYISKFTTQTTAREEAKMMEVIDKLDPTGIFHYPLIKVCDTHFTPMKCDDCPSDDQFCQDTCCNIVGSTTLLIYENGGEDLNRFSTRTAFMSPVGSFKPENMKSLYLGLWRLFFGLYVMHNNDYYHLDIKLVNITARVVNSETIVKYIDFGLMLKGSDFQCHTLTPTYMIYPPEIILLTRDNRADFVDIIKSRFLELHGSVIWPNKSATSTGYTQTIRDAIGSINQVMAELLPMTQKNVRKIYKRIDVYCLGLAINMLLSRLQGLATTPDDIEFTQKLLNLTHMMFEMNILKRIGPLAIFKHYISIVKDVYNIDMTHRLDEANLLIPSDRLEKIRSHHK